MNILKQTQDGLTQKQVLDELRPHWANLYKSIADGWAAWKILGENEPELRKPLNSRARAFFVYCHIVESAKRRFREVPGVFLSEKRGFLIIRFGKEVILRFKKLDSRGRARGAPTKQFKLFMEQQCLPGFESTQRNLIGGYKLDDLQTQIEDILIICPRGSDNQWYADLNVPLEQSGIETITPEGIEEAPIIRPVAEKVKKSKAE